MKRLVMHAFNYTCYVFTFISLFGALNVSAQKSESSIYERQSKQSHAASKLREEVVYKLLRAGQVALKNNQLTTPEHANAYDLFQSVLTLSPNHSIAQDGLQAILIRYASLIRASLGRNDIHGASRYLAVAQSRFPNNALLADLAKKIAADRRALKRSDSRDLAQKNNQNIVPLDAGLLNRKADAIKVQMIELGKKLAMSKEGILIYARSDREGRWLYKIINKAAKGYRVRGDIKLSKDPKIIIQPPF